MPGGRPQKYHSKEARQNAINKSNQKGRQRRKVAQQNPNRFLIEFDPRSLLQQGSLEGHAQVTEPAHGIQAEGLHVPADDEGFPVLEVAI